MASGGAGNDAMHDDEIEAEIEAEIRRLLGDVAPAPETPVASTTDKPRRIVVCLPVDCERIQAAVTALGYGDVLVQPNSFLPDNGKVYVLDPDFGVIQ